MPTYDYVCEACEHRFEAFQSMNDKRLKTCPKCKKRKLTRLIGTGAGIIFKGSGFYVTDYKRNGASGGGSNGGAKPSEPSGAKSGGSSDASSGGDKSCGTCGKTGPNVCD